MTNPPPQTLSLRSALRDDSERTPPLSGLTKAVQIADPDAYDIQEAPAIDDPPPRKQFTASVAAKRLSGRAAVVPPSSRTSIASQGSVEGLGTYMASPAQLPADSSVSGPSPLLRAHSHHHHHHAHRQRNLDQVSGRLLVQVAEWVDHEKRKRAAREARRARSNHSTRKATKSPSVSATADVQSTVKQHRTLSGESGDGCGADSGMGEEEHGVDEDEEQDGTAVSRHHHHHHRAPSTGSESSEVSLDRLQRIVDDNMAALGIDSLSSHAQVLRSGSGGFYSSASNSGVASLNSGRRHSRTLRNQPLRTASSDTDYIDGDVLVPSCDVVLDNSKTLKYAAVAGAASSPDTRPGSSLHEDKEREAWVRFKNEIIRLAHTLRLKGWRRVPLDSGETIMVERLSGALTNAVYVVSPPDEMPSGTSPSPATTPANNASSAVSSYTSLAVGSSSRRAQPSKLLLRIYGPQVEHLIDRENELSVLRRLARKKIGPRLLGTFANGRFEEFFTATTLTAVNLREPETSKQIAKRMRELHEGVELLGTELDGGPNVWRNWNRWLDAVEKRILYLDEVVDAARTETTFDASWKARGYVCGVPWLQFKALVEQQQALVQRYYGSSQRIRDQLVFAHNDTQYGNILRLRPYERSPLLEVANEHKQLIVIDFEYAAANPPGVEFANHFTEWMYNYHDAMAAHACQARQYPTPEQQRRFLRAYVDHRPAFPHQGGANTPRFGPLSVPAAASASSSSVNLSQQSVSSLPPLFEQAASEYPPAPATPLQSTTACVQPPSAPQHPASSASTIAEFMLDARAPPGGWLEEERRREELLERQVDELVAEARLWRGANSAQWVAWGIVQAKVTGLDEDTEAAVPDEDGFDYLAYAQDRAFFFLGDCVQAGLLSLEELPPPVRTHIKVVEY